MIGLHSVSPTFSNPLNKTFYSLTPIFNTTKYLEGGEATWQYYNRDGDIQEKIEELPDCLRIGEDESNCRRDRRTKC